MSTQVVAVYQDIRHPAENSGYVSFGTANSFDNYPLFFLTAVVPSSTRTPNPPTITPFIHPNGLGGRWNSSALLLTGKPYVRVIHLYYTARYAGFESAYTTMSIFLYQNNIVHQSVFPSLPVGNSFSGNGSKSFYSSMLVLPPGGDCVVKFHSQRSSGGGGIRIDRAGAHYVIIE
jgi:hypothetical protein